ncbi:type IV secretion protein VblB9 [Bartonella australis AUST/NH1]|uniref:Type IV secretion protein VblB9 n=1 Tax=Bartonella australis (strain Aust/NH1) TaxID=1094489 RepID=M1N4X0_BARAA|nr:P-type conjugative transfer protein VirB9 [Bartonella australis]AGF74934.1 type IV secretion protein VblB9 [Bartonella australis AUST/NH1]
MLKKILFPVFFGVIVICSNITIGYSEVSPIRAKGDNRVRFVNYDAYNVTEIVGSIRSSVQIEFAQDEEIAHVAIGNSIAWEVAPAGNIVFLKPREVQPITNLQIVTTRRDGSKRSYQFELKVRDGPVSLGNETYFLVKFRYPEDEAAQRRLEAQIRKTELKEQWADNVLNIHEQYGPRNWAYSAQGTYILEPKSVYDNGKTTTFTFSGNEDIPAIYVVGSDGKESLVPKSIKGNMVIVHAIGPQFILRRGKDVLCIFNEAYRPEGINPETGTISPSVKREIAIGNAG